MGASLRILALAALVAAGLASCGKHNPVSPNSSQPRNGGAGEFYALMDTALGGAEFFSTGGDAQSQLMTADADGTPVAFAIIRSGSRYVDAGTVRVWQSPLLPAAADTLARRAAPVNGTPWYLYTSVANGLSQPPITLDGVARHHFQLAGSANVGQFEDSILSVRRPTLTYPAEGAVVPRSSNLIVRWSDGSADTSVHVFGFLWSNVDSSLASGVGDARDPDGQATVDFAHSYVPAGSARLTVIRYRVVARTIGQIGVLLKSEGVVYRTVTLQ